MPKLKKSKSDAVVEEKPVETKRPLTRLTLGQKDTVHFEIDKKGRFSARFFQFILGIFSCVFTGGQRDDFLVAKELYGGVKFALAINALSIIASVGQVGIYMMPAFTKKWKGRKVLGTETIVDVLVFSLLITGMIIEGILAAGKCSAGLSGDCDRFNLAMMFQGFSLVSWIAALAFDGISWYKGLSPKTDISPVTIRALLRK